MKMPTSVDIFILEKISWPAGLSMKKLYNLEARSPVVVCYEWLYCWWILKINCISQIGWCWLVSAGMVIWKFFKSHYLFMRWYIKLVATKIDPRLNACWCSSISFGFVCISWVLDLFSCKVFFHFKKKKKRYLVLTWGFPFYNQIQIHLLRVWILEIVLEGHTLSSNWINVVVAISWMRYWNNYKSALTMQSAAANIFLAIEV